MSARLEIAITLNEPVMVVAGNKTELARSVEWCAFGWYTANGDLHTRIYGVARGNYSSLTTFHLEDKPDWAPPCPPDMETILRSLMAHEKEYGKTVCL